MQHKEFEEWKALNHGDFGALLNFAYENNCEESVNDIISTDDVDDFVKAILENTSWQGAACCLFGIINNLGDDYYRIDGYGNLETLRDWDMYADDIESNLEFDEITCDLCGEYSEAAYSISEWIDELEDELKLTEKEKNTLLSKESFSDICEDCFRNMVEGIRA